MIARMAKFDKFSLILGLAFQKTSYTMVFWEENDYLACMSLGRCFCFFLKKKIGDKKGLGLDKEL